MAASEVGQSEPTIPLDVFLTALKALPKAERNAVVVRIARDKPFALDILDLAPIAKRRGEPSRLFRQLRRRP